MRNLALALAVCTSACTSSALPAGIDGGGQVPDLAGGEDRVGLADRVVPDLAPPGDLATVDLTPAGPICGGRGGRPCDPAEFCDIPVGCGRADETGTCQERPQVCFDLVDPVCGCDGQPYPNDCYRQRAGVSLWNRGVCGCASQCGAGHRCELCWGKLACLPDGAVC